MDDYLAKPIDAERARSRSSRGIGVPAPRPAPRRPPGDGRRSTRRSCSRASAATAACWPRWSRSFASDCPEDPARGCKRAVRRRRSRSACEPARTRSRDRVATFGAHRGLRCRARARDDGTSRRPERRRCARMLRLAREVESPPRRRSRRWRRGPAGRATRSPAPKKSPKATTKRAKPTTSRRGRREDR